MNVKNGAIAGLTIAAVFALPGLLGGGLLWGILIFGIIIGLAVFVLSVTVGGAMDSRTLSSCRVKNGEDFQGRTFTRKGKLYKYDEYVKLCSFSYHTMKEKELKKLEDKLLESLKQANDPIMSDGKNIEPEFIQVELDAVRTALREKYGVEKQAPSSKDIPVEYSQPEQKGVQEHVPSVPDNAGSKKAEELEAPPRIDTQCAAVNAKLARVGEQLFTLELRMAGRMDGVPTKEGVQSALQQGLIDKKKAEEAYAQIRELEQKQAQDHAEYESLVELSSALQKELDTLSNRPASSSAASAKKFSRPAVIFGVISAVLLVSVIALSVQFSRLNAKYNAMYSEYQNTLEDYRDLRDFSINLASVAKTYKNSVVKYMVMEKPIDNGTLDARFERAYYNARLSDKEYLENKITALYSVVYSYPRR